MADRICHGRGMLGLVRGEKEEEGVSNAERFGLNLVSLAIGRGDVEHTHLVKGLDYALLNKIRSEINKKPDSGEESDGKQPRASKEDQQLLFCTATAKSVYQWIVKPQTAIKSNEMFLPGRMTFIFNMENGYSHGIPTMVHRSRVDCPQPKV
ncbi:suppressor of mec-8 and unc-52 protein homolog 2-like [Humulus lupulus]|uniref:suppressor of mec-8 and unc-52 protein homolog 2-like n=1 Tax=Humulus lupulus TaxID=3486 RepID=UPI002B412BB8|nr:suppressor of mec-8 and unc-52 protein homolog 2-like [Humulus lupulus]